MPSNISRYYIALDNLADALKKLQSNNRSVSLVQIRESLKHIHHATALLQALECSLMGIPEAKEGE